MGTYWRNWKASRWSQFPAKRRYSRGFKFSVSHSKREVDMSQLGEGISPPQQLRMTISAENVLNLPHLSPPEGYILREYRPGDEDSWLELLQLAGFDNWDQARMDRYLLDLERREGSRVVSHSGTIVAATFADRGMTSREFGVLDHVATHPLHRTKGLGRVVCTSVMKFLVARGCPAVTLWSDDWRLPAIKLYLSLGFIPEMDREDMPSRWDVVMDQISS